MSRSPGSADQKGGPHLGFVTAKQFREIEGDDARNHPSGSDQYDRYRRVRTATL